jgi:hypothetical protein
VKNEISTLPHQSTQQSCAASTSTHCPGPVQAYASFGELPVVPAVPPPAPLVIPVPPLLGAPDAPPVPPEGGGGLPPAPPFCPSPSLFSPSLQATETVTARADARMKCRVSANTVLELTTASGASDSVDNLQDFVVGQDPVRLLGAAENG